jgi:putative ABC transport system ATP-binding protein
MVADTLTPEAEIGADRAVLEARDIYRFYRAGIEEVLALRGVSLALAPGEVVVVSGPSGSGKSTLLSCLAGLDEPDGGQVWIAGELLSHRSEAERTLLRRRLVGVLRQSDNLVQHLSVLANVRLAQGLRSRRERAGLPSAEDLLQRVGLGGRGGRLPSQLSGGELARAGLAVALAADPRVLVADEPTGELDRTSERLVLQLLRAAADRGAAVVVASHSHEVARAGDRVLRLEYGRWATAPREMRA